MGYLTTHVLDTATGRPAAGLRIALYRLDGSQDGGQDGGRELLAETATNEDGRTDGHILPESDFRTGAYELVFQAGDYLRGSGQGGDEPLFLDEIPLRFGISDGDAHYHVPLLLSPYGYSTYRGS